MRHTGAFGTKNVHTIPFLKTEGHQYRHKHNQPEG